MNCIIRRFDCFVVCAMAFVCVLPIKSWGQDANRATVEYATKTNVLYRTDEGLNEYMRQRCLLDVYYPSNQTGFSTVVWFHGGGLTAGERSVPAALKANGIAVVGAGYRLSPGARAPEYIEDAAAAVAWTFKNIEKLGGDKNRIFVSGHSAGGYLASMVVMDKRWLRAHDIDPDSVAGVIPLSGQAITHFTVRKERGIDKTQPIVDELAPMSHVRKDMPPMLLITGDREKELLGRYEENAYLWRMMKVIGHADTKLVELPGYGHGEMAEPAFPLLLEFIRQRTKD